MPWSTLVNRIPPHWFPLTRQLVNYVREESRLVSAMVGECALTFYHAVGYIAQGRINRKALIPQCAFIGVDALGIALLLTLFSGMVLALQIAQELTRQGAGTLVGSLVSLSILRELAPLMTGFAVIAMVGSAYCAELATMSIQEQVDALKVLQVNPIRYLIVPRLIAAATMLPMMTMLASLAGIMGGMMISFFIGDLNPNTFLESVWSNIETSDIFGALFKSAVFGELIVLISCSMGLGTRGGAKDVGESTTRAVVWSFVAMTLADYALSFMLFSGQD